MPAERRAKKIFLRQPPQRAVAEHVMQSAVARHATHVLASPHASHRLVYVPAHTTAAPACWVRR